MALADEVKSRYSTQFLAGVTNPQNSAPTTINDTTLGKACTDIESAFSKKGILFDVTDADHVSTAVEGVVALLRKRCGQLGGYEEWREWLTDLDALRLVTANDRILPRSSSELTPTDENPNNDNETRPAFDIADFDHFVPDDKRSPSRRNSDSGLLNT
jgi:hypothetical protein